jgi:D-3-phosphoglycerate dehydrogenase
MGKLLICDPVATSAIEAIRSAGIEVDVRDDITPDQLAEVVGDYEGMVVRSRTKVRVPLIDKAVKMKVIIRGGVGIDNIDAEYAESKGIDVRNTPTASSNAVAELALGLMFAMCRRIPEADTSMKTRKWDKKKLKGTEISGKTLGIIGYGRIGRTLGKKAKALGMKVMAFDPFVSHEDIVPLSQLLTDADVISLHLPHTDKTHHLLGADQFAMMKSGVMIVQASRGGTLDEQALYDALIGKHVAAAALDVFSEEPPKSDMLTKLISLPQVVTSPHIGASTSEAQTRIGEEIVQLATSYLS